jgi:hypothetical protein
MPIRLAVATRSAMATAIKTAAEAGTAPKLRIYSGAQPATGDTAASGTLLVDITLPDPAFTESGGVWTLADPGSVNVTTGGVAGWFRILTSADANVLDGSVGTSGTDLIVASTTFTAGVGVDIQSGGTITVPAG